MCVLLSLCLCFTHSSFYCLDWIGLDWLWLQGWMRVAHMISKKNSDEEMAAMLQALDNHVLAIPLSVDVKSSASASAVGSLARSSNPFSCVDCPVLLLWSLFVVLRYDMNAMRCAGLTQPGEGTIRYKFKVDTTTWPLKVLAADPNTPLPSVFQYALPHHRDTLVRSPFLIFNDVVCILCCFELNWIRLDWDCDSSCCVAQSVGEGIKGPFYMVYGNEWEMKEILPPLSWFNSHDIRSDLLPKRSPLSSSSFPPPPL